MLGRLRRPCAQGLYVDGCMCVLWWQGERGQLLWGRSVCMHGRVPGWLRSRGALSAVWGGLGCSGGLFAWFCKNYIQYGCI